MNEHMRQRYIDLLEEKQVEVRLERADAIQRSEEAIAEAEQAVQKAKRAVTAASRLYEELCALQAALAEVRGSDA